MPLAHRREGVDVLHVELEGPFCHEGVATNDPGWVACSGCLARHHGACWDERGSCASCGGARRLVADERRPASDPEVAAMVGRGDRAAAILALRQRGLDLRAAEVAVDLAQAAAAATGVRLVQAGDEEGSDWGAPVEVAAWALQGLALLCAAGVALLGEASGAALAGIFGLGLGVLGLILACVLGRSAWSRFARLIKATLDAAAVSLGFLVVAVTNAPAHRPSLGLFLLGLLMAAASGALAIRAARGGAGS